MSKEFSPNMTDLEFTKCPFCDKDMEVESHSHRCQRILTSKEYINDKAGIRLLWITNVGWFAYDMLDDNAVIGRLTFAEVFNCVKHNEFIPVKLDW